MLPFRTIVDSCVYDRDEKITLFVDEANGTYAGHGCKSHHLHHKHTLKAYVIQQKQGGLGKVVRRGTRVRLQVRIL